MSSGKRLARTLRAEWTKLRSVPSTTWLLLAAAVTTVAFGLLVCSAVDTAGASPGCVPGRPGCSIVPDARITSGSGCPPVESTTSQPSSRGVTEAYRAVQKR